MGCPNSTDVDTFTLIETKIGTRLPPSTLDSINAQVVKYMSRLLEREDVETTIVLVQGNRVMFAEKGSVDGGANLIAQTFRYWNTDECPIVKGRRSVWNGVFETFNKINLALVKLEGRYSDGWLRSKLSELSKKRLFVICDFYAEHVDMRRIFAANTAGPNKEHIAQMKKNALKATKLEKQVRQLQSQLEELKKRPQDALLEATMEKLAQVILKKQRNIAAIVVDARVSESHRTFWKPSSGLKKIAYQVVKAALLLMGYECFTKELDVPVLHSAPWVRALVPLMNRRVDLADSAALAEALQVLQRGFEFLLSSLREIMREAPRCRDMQGRALNVANRTFTTDALQQLPIPAVQFPVNEELKDASMYPQCRLIEEPDLGPGAVAICKGCHVVVAMAQLPVQLNYKKKALCCSCFPKYM